MDINKCNFKNEFQTRSQENIRDLARQLFHVCSLPSLILPPDLPNISTGRKLELNFPTTYKQKNLEGASLKVISLDTLRYNCLCLQIKVYEETTEMLYCRGR